MSEIIEGQKNEIHESKDNLNIETLSPKNKDNNILGKCSELYPLKLVDTIERLYQTIINNTEYSSLNTLSKYKEKHEITYDLIDFKLKTPNSSKIITKMKDINCIKIAEDKLFIGENNGFVYNYKIETGIEKECYGVKGSNSPVSAIENKGNEELLVGYENGTINIFDIKKETLIKSIKDIHKTKILSIKFILKEKNNYQLVSADEEGQVMYIISSNSMLSKKNVGNIIYQDSEPTYAITKLKPFEERKSSIFAFASSNKVRVYLFESKFLSIYEIKKPSYTENNDIPDISLGWGIPPLQEGISLKKLGQREKEILLAVGWGKVITLYKVNQKGVSFHIKQAIGFFENNCSIIRLGFFSSSILYFFDKTAQIKVINTAFCDYGEYDNSKEKDNKNGLIDEGKILDKNMKYNILSKTEEKEYCHYRNFIYNMNKCIYLFSNEGLRIGKILNYKKLIQNIIENGHNWKSAMFLAIDIYKGNNINFPGLSLDENERQKELKPYLVELLNKYIDYNFNVRTESISVNEVMPSNDNISEINDDRIIECIIVSIEFCLEIKEFDYLLSDVETTFNKYGKGDLFYKLFESFIFNDELLTKEIGVDALTSIFGAYKIKNELVLLSHLLTHINIKSLNNFMIKKLAIKENLFNLIIFIFSNGEYAEDFFLPISKMFCAYLRKNKKEEEVKENKEKDNENEHKYFSYYNLYIKKGIEGINQMESCKEYIGHKLLWYIEMCLKGNKYASWTEVDLLKFEINSENYKKFIAYIYFWILQEETFITFLNFDSYSFFYILSLFFTNPTLMKIIKNYDFSTINSDLIQKLIEDQEKNIYLMKNMNVLGKLLTMKPQEKNNNNILEVSKTIPPEKDKIDLKEEQKDKEEMKEGENKPEKEQSKEESKVKEEDEKKENEKTNEPSKEEKEKKENEKGNEPSKEEKEIKKKQIDENFDPFETSKGPSTFGKGVKLNDLNSVLSYIIKIVKSQKSYFSQLDLNTFLIKYASKYNDKEPFPEDLRKCVLDGFINCLKFFTEYQQKRREYILHNEDKFNIHSLSKKYIDSQDPYFIYVSNLLKDLLNLKKDTFNEMELGKLKDSSDKTEFNSIKIRIFELLKEYEKCLDIFINEKTEKAKENVFPWLEEKFEDFTNEIKKEEEEEEKKNKKDNKKDNKKKKKHNPKEDIMRLKAAVITKIKELANIKIEKAKKILGNYFYNDEKLKAYNMLKDNEEKQIQFLEQILYQPLDQLNEENDLNYLNIDENENIDLFKLYLKNMKQKEKINEKRIREDFHKLLIDQIHLLIVLKRKKEILNVLKKNISYYPNFPLRDALRECVENDVTDSAIYIFQYLDESRNALKLTENNLENSFKSYVEKNIDNNDFDEKLEVCKSLCKENSESLMKRVLNERDENEKKNEGQDLWFDLLKKLYEFEGVLEKKEGLEENKKKQIQNNLQKGIEKLLQEMNDYVSIQDLVEYVTNNQERAQYKEFKSILELMLRTNTSFDKVLHNVMDILKDSIINSELQRKKSTSKGNNYNYKKCDVCEKNFENSPTEIIYCFGCGHQSHEKCAYIRKIKEDHNKNVINTGKIEDNPNFRPECVICHRNRITQMNEWENIDEETNIVQQIKDDEEEQNKIRTADNKIKTFKYGNKKNKLSKITKYDNNYENEVSIFY